jgi:hypothetical protein
MNDAFFDQNDYGLILLRDSYNAALAESEEMYDKECERKGNRTPKNERSTRYLLGIKENVLSGQVGLYVPPRQSPIEIPGSAVTAPHLDNPLWVEYDFINGATKMVLGALPFGHFGVGMVNPIDTRKILEGLAKSEARAESTHLMSMIGAAP